jgi:hypothetical protein
MRRSEHHLRHALPYLGGAYAMALLESLYYRNNREVVCAERKFRGSGKFAVL